MTITKEVSSFSELYENSWSGAISTLDTIQDHDMEDELMKFLEEEFSEGASETEVNDFLWFEDEYIFDRLGISTEDEEDEEE